MKPGRRWHVYVLRCADGTLYTGATTDPARRLAEHNAGTAAAYTRSRRPVTLAWSAAGFTRSSALSREAAIKSLPRAVKDRLIRARRS